MKNNKEIILDKLYKIIESVESLDAAVEDVSVMIASRLGSDGSAILDNLATVGDGIVKCISGMDRAIARMNRL